MIEQVFICSKHEVVVASQNKLEECPECGEKLSPTGWFEGNEEREET